MGCSEWLDVSPDWTSPAAEGNLEVEQQTARPQCWWPLMSTCSLRALRGGRFGCAPNEQGGLLPLAKSLAVAWGKDNIQARPPSHAVLSASG